MIFRSLALAASASVVLAACGAAPNPAQGESVGESTADLTVYGSPVCSTTIYGPVCSPEKISGCTGTTPVVTWNPQTTWPTVIPSPSIHLVFWGSYWTGAGAADANATVTAWSKIGKDPRFWQPLTEYSAPGGPTISPAIDPATSQIRFAATFDSAALAGYSMTAPGVTVPIAELTASTGTLAREFDTHVLPDPALEPGTIWVVMFPPNMRTSDCSAATCGSEHDFIFYPAGSGRMVPWAAIEGPKSNGTNPFFSTAKERGLDIVISHEVYEATSDFMERGWYAPTCANGGAQEIADLCEGYVSDPIDGYTVSTLWSNAAKGCVGPSSLNTSTPIPTCGKCATNGDTLVTRCAPACIPKCFYGQQYCYSTGRCIPSTQRCPLPQVERLP